jgi:uncharacterized C2H2 Zn-finger protein
MEGMVVMWTVPLAVGVAEGVGAYMFKCPSCGGRFRVVKRIF